MSDELKPCKLKPCKHCGGEARFQIFDTTCNVECQQCGIGTRNVLLDNYQECVCKWNRSADDAPEQPVDNAQADSRERLETEVMAAVGNLVKYCGAHPALFEKAKSWLDRQDAITSKEWCHSHDALEEELERVRAERDELREELRIEREAVDACKGCDKVDSLTAERDELRDKLREKQHVCDVQRDSFLKLERENRELQDACGELEHTLENIRRVS